jgi:hypothetical protein
MAEKTLNDSEAILGCLSPSDCRSNGVRMGNSLWRVDGGCVEKKRARKERQVICKVDVDVVGDCDRTDFEVDTMSGTWLVREPGSTVNSEVRRLKPACRTAGGVFDDFNWLSNAFDREGTCDLRSE